MDEIVANHVNKISLLFQQLTHRPMTYLGGLVVLCGLCFFYFIILKSVLQVGESTDWFALLQDPYLHHVIFFSFAQASLSALLSLLVGLLFARAFFYQDFKGKSLVLRLFSLTFVLPALVAIFGLLGVYGSSGWLAQLLKFFQLDWTPNFYGLTGILVAHLFFNIPLAARMFLQCFHSIPNQQRQLAAQLNLRGWQFIRLIELPYLRQQMLPIFTLIFMLCFTSFTIVLALGGGPKFTTLEVAIYQAILFEFDLPKGALFALLQAGLCLGLFVLSSLFSTAPATQLDQRESWRSPQSSAVRFYQVLLIISVLIFLILPLANTAISAFVSPDWQRVWLNPSLWRAMGYSLSLALCSALLSLIMAIALLLFARRLQWQGYTYVSQGISTIGMLILAIPTLVIAMGLFILLQDLAMNIVHLFFIVAFCNALGALPFAVRILAVPMNNNMMYYEKLCQSLNIQGWQRFRLIEWHHLQSPLKYVFALSATLSLGDFTAIALFGNQQFTSLPRLLYQQLGHYRTQEAAVTALILLLFCLSIFLLIERHKDAVYD